MRTFFKMMSIITFTSVTVISYGQKQISLYKERPADSKEWKQKEDSMYSDLFKTEVVYNVTDPSLIEYLPATGTATGAAVIIAPGGGFQSLSINKEGVDLAKYLSQRGIAAFVLKYRLLESKTKDPAKEMMANIKDRAAFTQRTMPIRAMAGDDVKTAMKYIRSHSSQWSINPDKLGVIGFSAGASVILETVLQSTDTTTIPNFAACIYGDVTPNMLEATIPARSLPMFICAASDDQLGLAPKSILLYSKWLNAHQPVELHMYEKGGHGFGMGKNNLPVEHWIDQYINWLQNHGYSK